MGILKVLIVAAALASSGLTLYDEGVQSYQNQNYEKANKIFRTLALEGHAGAEGMLGIMYIKGHGVEKNDALASIWLFKSASKGFASAQLAIGALHVKGIGVRANVLEAYKWLRLAENSNEENVKVEATRILQLVTHLISDEEKAQLEVSIKNWRPQGR